MIGAADSNRRANRQEEKRKKIFHNLLTIENKLLNFAM
jgi:hypothetical protein